MATLDEIVREYDKNMVLKVCQRQAFDYLSEKKGDLMVSLNTCFGTTFETLAEIEREQGPTTLHGRLVLDGEKNKDTEHWTLLVIPAGVSHIRKH